MIGLAFSTVLMQAGGAGAGAPGTATDHQTLLIWAVILMGVAVVMMIVEIFVPSGGVLGLLSGVAAISSIVLFFWFNQTAGMIALIATLIAAPIAVAFGLRAIPHTPFFRLIALTDEVQSERQRAEEAGPPVGAPGQAVTDLRPVGTCLIDGRRLDCLAVGPWIERDQPVVVLGQSTGQVRVKLAAEQEPAAD